MIVEKKKGPRRMPSTLISVTNESSRVSDHDVAKMVRAIGVQLARDVAPIWGLVPALEFVPSGVHATAGSMRCTVLDTPDVPGAAGYHDEGSDGLPYIKVFTFAGDPPLVGATALSVTLSHEIIELALDPAANLWADGKDGADYAREGCDAPEAEPYEIDGVSVSNFVYPAFFDPNAAQGSKFDHLEKLTAPFETPAGGYQIRRTEPGKVGQVFGRHRKSGHDVQDLGDGLFIVFGSAYPEQKKAGKIAKTKRRRGTAQ